MQYCYVYTYTISVASVMGIYYARKQWETTSQFDSPNSKIQICIVNVIIARLNSLQLNSSCSNSAWMSLETSPIRTCYIQSAASTSRGRGVNLSDPLAASKLIGDGFGGELTTPIYYNRSFGLETGDLLTSDGVARNLAMFH